jgi:hypothetical protein
VLRKLADFCCQATISPAEIGLGVFHGRDENWNAHNISHEL